MPRQQILIGHEVEMTNSQENVGSHLRHPSNPTHFSSQGFSNDATSNPNMIKPFIPTGTPVKTNQYPGEEVLFSFANDVNSGRENENELETYHSGQPENSRAQLKPVHTSLSKAMKSELFDLITEFKDKWPLEGFTRKKCDDLVKRMVLDGHDDDDAFSLFRGVV